MGLPQGWTAQKPLSPLSMWEAGMCSRPWYADGPSGLRPWYSLSLFSGCGALDWALLPWVKPVGYCEKEEGAKRVLQARMDDGCLPQAVIFDDVRTVTGELLRARDLVPRMLTGGFPCQDICQAGLQEGLQGARSGLFSEIVRLIDEIGPHCEIAFLENVDAIRRLPQVWKVVLDAFLERGFSVRWVSLPATAVGCPQERRRWFLLAKRGAAGLHSFATPLPLNMMDAPGVSAGRPRVRQPAGSSGLQFNSGRPAPGGSLAARREYRDLRERLCMLGNAVVPQQARLAARLLSTDW